MLFVCGLCFAAGGIGDVLAGGAAGARLAARGIAGFGDHKHRGGNIVIDSGVASTVAFGGFAGWATVMPDIPRSMK